jgi:hypothetical protein
MFGPFIEADDFAQAQADEPAQTDPGRADSTKKQGASFFSAVRPAGFLSRLARR